MGKKYQKGWFNCCGNSNVLEGYSIINERWNGFSCPCFTKEVLDEYIKSFECEEWYEVLYSKKLDTYFFIDLCCDNDVTQYKGRDIVTVSGEIKHVYDFGSHSFVWEREEHLDDYLKFKWVNSVIKEKP